MDVSLESDVCKSLFGENRRPRPEICSNCHMSVAVGYCIRSLDFIFFTFMSNNKCYFMYDIDGYCRTEIDSS